ncbi:MAG TPA: integrase arm-type DNA-binding domain-containing protein, partial [Xanthobacteraceae bacterium]|nr:integrase arm-type DNA-binding domain-containing protein [Xanthobacteraceae bacterium]
MARSERFELPTPRFVVRAQPLPSVAERFFLLPTLLIRLAFRWSVVPPYSVKFLHGGDLVATSMKLTQRTVDALEPQATPYIEYDDDLKGFGIKVYPTGVMSWIVEFRPGAGGRRTNKKRMTIGKTDKLDPGQARALAKAKLAEIALGGDPLAARQKQRQQATVAEMLARFVAEYVPAHYAETTKREVLRHIEKNILPAFGSCKVAELSRAEIKAWHAKFADRKSEGNLALAYFSKAMSVASIEWELRADNPCQGISKFPTKARERVFSRNEIAAFGAALDAGERSGRYPKGVYVAFRLLVLTTMRRGEVLSLQWSMIDLERREIRLPTGKGGFRVVPIGAAVAQYLATLDQGGPFVCCGAKADKPISLATYKRAWAVLRDAAGLTDAHGHDWRHTGATMIAQDGASAFVLK